SSSRALKGSSNPIRASIASSASAMAWRPTAASSSTTASPISWPPASSACTASTSRTPSICAPTSSRSACRSRRNKPKEKPRIAPGFFVSLLEAAALLDHFDLVAIRVRGKEEFCHRHIAIFEVDQLAHGQAFGRKSGMLSLDIIHHHRQMAIAIAKRIRLGAALVDRQFQLETNLVAGHVDQRKIRKIHPVCDLQPERLFVIGHRAGLIDDADHRVNKFC